MGVLNVTPDSFSDGGRWVTHDSAIEGAREMVAAGAAIIDVGGESTRPGAARVDEDEELRRVLPIVRTLAQDGIAVSIDTMRSEVARKAVAAGAAIVNDVSGGIADQRMFATVAELAVPYVLSHWRAHSGMMDKHDHYDDVVSTVRAELAARIDAYGDAGGDDANLILDPGLGFAKARENNWPLLARLDELQALGFPLLIGASRKRFLAAVMRHGEVRPVSERDAATVAVTTLVAERGAWAVRVHDVAGSADAIRVVSAYQEAKKGQ